MLSQSTHAGYYCAGSNNPYPSGQCYAGYFCLSASTSPTQNECPAGKFSSQGASECTSCVPGTWQPYKAQSSCVLAPSVQFQCAEQRCWQKYSLRLSLLSMLAGFVPSWLLLRIVWLNIIQGLPSGALLSVNPCLRHSFDHLNQRRSSRNLGLYGVSLPGGNIWCPGSSPGCERVYTMYRWQFCPHPAFSSGLVTVSVEPLPIYFLQCSIISRVPHVCARRSVKTTL